MPCSEGHLVNQERACCPLNTFSAAQARVEHHAIPWEQRHYLLLNWNRQIIRKPENKLKLLSCEDVKHHLMLKANLVHYKHFGQTPLSPPLPKTPKPRQQRGEQKDTTLIQHHCLIACLVVTQRYKLHTASVHLHHLTQINSEFVK